MTNEQKPPATGRKPRIYLCSPFSSPSDYVECMRYCEICKVSARLICEGFHVFSPIAHSFGIAEYGGMKCDWAAWRDIDQREMDLSDELWVCTMEGWQESKGITAEIQYFHDRYPFRPIRTVDPMTLEIEPMPLVEPGMWGKMEGKHE